MRIRTNFAKGVVETTALATGSTVLTSADLAGLPVVTTGNHVVITLDPLGDDGAPEIVHVTAHVAAASTATITRAREGTTARAHALNTPWVHGPTGEDFGAVVKDWRSIRGPRKVFSSSDNFEPVRTEPAVSHPDDDEFDDEVIDSAWYRHDFRPVDVRRNESAGVLSIRHYTEGRASIGVNELYAMLKPVGGLVIGQSIETCVSFCGANVAGPKWGLMFSNGVTHGTGGSAQVMTTIDLSTTAGYRSLGTRTHIGFSNTPSVTTTSLSPMVPNRTFLRLRWTAANTFRAEISADGVNWLDNLVADRTTTLTPTHMGLWFGPFSTLSQFALSFEYFRVNPFKEGWEY